MNKTQCSFPNRAIRVMGELLLFNGHGCLNRRRAARLDNGVTTLIWLHGVAARQLGLCFG